MSEATHQRRLEEIGLRQQNSVKEEFQPTQLVLIGFGMVSRTMMTIMLRLNSRLALLPIVIIEPKQIIPQEKAMPPSGAGECPVSCKYEKETPDHEPEVIRSEIFAKLMAANKNITVVNIALTPDNYREIFEKHVNQNAIVVELAVRLDTASLIQECQRKRCLYVNTAIDTWEYVDDSLFSVKQEVLEKVKYEKNEPKMTAVCNHGMNPGLVSHFVKHLLASLVGKSSDKRLAEWKRAGKYGHIARELGLTLIQIAERDNQTTPYMSSEKCFFNTWSVVGFIDEATLPTEISWGTHERALPYHASTREKKASTQIILPIPAYQVRTQSYEPKGGMFTGYCIPHAEAYSIANALRIGSAYVPSVYYSYLLPDTAKLMTHYLDYALNKEHLPKREHVLRADEIKGGYDSVGVLVFFRQQQKGKEKAFKKYWVGSIVDNEMAKAISPEINCTCMQVGISVLACVEWMLRNPHRGIMEPDEVDTDFIIEFCRDWLGEFYIADVSEKCAIESDQLAELLTAPNNILFK